MHDHFQLTYQNFIDSTEKKTHFGNIRFSETECYYSSFPSHAHMRKSKVTKFDEILDKQGKQVQVEHLIEFHQKDSYYAKQL